MPSVRLDDSYSQKPNGSLRMNDYWILSLWQLGLVEPSLQMHLRNTMQEISVAVPDHINIHSNF